MRLRHILIEGYCDQDTCIRNQETPHQSMGVHCLSCPQFNYTAAPYKLSFSGEDGSIQTMEDWIAFGGEMDNLSLWKQICRRKIQEAYEEYVSADH